MKSPATTLICVSVAIVIFCGLFIANPPSPRYHPVEHVWTMPGQSGPGPAMGWYGRTGTAVLAGGIGFVIASSFFALRKREVGLSSKSVYLIVFVVVAALGATTVAIVREQVSWFQKVPAPTVDHEY